MLPAGAVPLTPMCSDCDFELAADMAALPPERAAKILEAIRRMVEFQAKVSGTILPSQRPKALAGNVIQLRIRP